MVLFGKQMPGARRVGIDRLLLVLFHILNCIFSIAVWPMKNRLSEL